MALRVGFSPEAATDLIKLSDYIAEQSGPMRAIGYIDRIEAYCAGFEASPERGTRRDDLRPGLRIVGFEDRATIAFHTTSTTVIIDRILYGAVTWNVRCAVNLRDRDVKDRAVASQ